MEVRFPVSEDTVLTIKLTDRTVVSVLHKVSEREVASGLTLIRNEQIRRRVFQRYFPRTSPRRP